MTMIADNLQRVRSRISDACGASGRAPESVTLLAVSKTFGADAVIEAAQAGQRAFGENYVQEAAAKWPGFRAEFGPVAVHMIGPLQTNKAKEAVTLFDVIETIDRDRLADAVANDPVY